MIDRRAFLQGMGMLALGQGLSGCQGAEGQSQILMLRGSIPPQLIRRFQQITPDKGEKLVFQSVPQLKELYDRLQNAQNPDGSSFFGLGKLPWKSNQKANISGLSTLGDYWLQDAIQKGVIQPLALEKFSGWRDLPASWQQISRRDRHGQPTPGGQVWGAPYRWGCTMIAYRRDKLKSLGWVPQDWSDLWREEVKRRISIVDQPREVIGLTLKSLGQSYNTRNLSAITKLKSQLQALDQQILYYSSRYYLQPLLVGDTWLAVGWSSDILPLLKNNPELDAIIPQSGTRLFGDLWVRPTQVSENSALPPDLRSWIEYCWQPETAEQIARLTQGGSPILFAHPPASPPNSTAQRLFWGTNADLIDRSEFLEPLSAQADQQYESLWKAIRDPGANPKQS